jgi:sporulation protein YlmC with PRC-barrel domain
MVTVRDITGLFGREVFTTKGLYAGKVEDVKIDMNKFRIRAIVVDAARGSFLANLAGGKRGVVVPFSMVQSAGDIVIIKHVTGPVGAEMEEAVQ